MATGDKLVTLDGLKAVHDHTQGQVSDLKSAIGYDPTVIAEIEQYSINTTGKNTTSSYTAYYRTGGFYQPKHIKATSTRGTLKTAVYFYQDADVNTFVSANTMVADLDADITYPQGAKYVRVAGFVDGNPDNPLDLSAVTVEMTMPADKADSKIKTLENDVAVINQKLESTDIDNAVVSDVDTSVPYNLIPSDIVWTPDKQISSTDGSVGSYTGRYASGMIPIDASRQYIFLHIAVTRKTYNEATGEYTSNTVAPFVRYNWAFYDEEGNFVPCESDSAAIVKAIPATAKYIRVTVSSEESLNYARLIYADSASSPMPTVSMVQYKKVPVGDYQMPHTGYESMKMVCFGDSITHGDLTGNNDGVSYVDYASQYLNTQLLNVGFGSSSAARTSETLTETKLFAFWHLCDCIVSDDANVWDDLDAWAASGNTTYAPHLTRLKAIDWTQINAISILYGANDWAANVPVGTEYNIDPYNYDGAIAYGITKLLTKYPHLQVMVLSPFYRKRTIDGVDYISDDPNTAGLTMNSYAESLKNVQEKLHTTVIKSNNWGLNYLSMKSYSIDGTHPITNLGKQRLGHMFANAVMANLSPI